MHDYVILSDFDGTICEDLSTLIYTAFAGVGMHYADLWSLGKISTPEEIKKTFETIDAGESELAERIIKAEIDPAFPDFVRLCRKSGMDIAVVSDGLEWAIRIVLTHHGVQDIDVYANQIRFLRTGYEFSFPWQHERCPHAGVCKPVIIEKCHANGQRVIYIGDGRSDRDAIYEADVVYAKDELLAYCQAENVPAIAYQNFNNLNDAIKSGDFPPSIL